MNENFNNIPNDNYQFNGGQQIPAPQKEKKSKKGCFIVLICITAIIIVSIVIFGFLGAKLFDNGKEIVESAFSDSVDDYDEEDDYDFELEETTVEQTTKEETTKKETTTSSKKDDSKVTPSFKKTMDAYEKFFDEYVEFMKKYEKADTSDYASLMVDYAKYTAKYAEYMEELDNYNEEEMSTADTAYLIKVQARITEKLAELL